MSPRRRRLLVAASTLFASVILAYVGSVILRTHTLYSATKVGARGWKGNVHRSDADLGLAPRPGGIGAETFPIGPDVPSRIDGQGFRVPLEIVEPASLQRPIVLALGCSYTYGSSVLAEQTFAWRVAEGLGGSALNAGICSSGVAQMLLRARELIPRHRPDIVLVQYSPWFVERSRQRFAPTFAGLIPTPRFVQTEGVLRLQPPSFESIAFELPVGEFRASERSAGDFARFLWHVGLPLFVHDDVLMSVLALQRPFVSEPSAASNEEIIALAYPEIAALCREQGARMVVVWFESTPFTADWRAPVAIADLGVPIVCASRRLIELLPERTREAYARTWTLFRGDPPRSVDGHPNDQAHARIAEEILKVLR